MVVPVQVWPGAPSLHLAMRDVQQRNFHVTYSEVKGKIEEIKELCIRYHVVKLDIFGSAATENLKPNDLDFLVEFQSLPPGEHAKAYFNLLEDL